jgi:hypothetical protein
MRKSLLLACVILLVANLSYAQPVIETEGGGGGLDVMSVVIGAVIGLVIGYLVGSKMAKK